MLQNISLERVVVSPERVEVSLDRVITIIFFIKGCQVAKTPVYKSGCNLFEVLCKQSVLRAERTEVDGRLSSITRAEQTERSMLISIPTVPVFMMKLWHFAVVNMLFAAEFSREFEPIYSSNYSEMPFLALILSRI